MKKLLLLLLCWVMCVSFSGCQSESVEEKNGQEDVIEEIKYVETKVGGFTFEIPENWEGKESAENEQVGSYIIKDKDSNDIGNFSIIVQPNMTDEHLRSFTEFCVGLLDEVIDTSKINYTVTTYSNSNVCEFEGGETTVGGKEWTSFGKTVAINSGLNFTIVSVEESYADTIKEEFDHIIESMLE